MGDYREFQSIFEVGADEGACENSITDLSLDTFDAAWAKMRGKNPRTDKTFLGTTHRFYTVGMPHPWLSRDVIDWEFPSRDLSVSVLGAPEADERAVNLFLVKVNAEVGNIIQVLDTVPEDEGDVPVTMSALTKEEIMTLMLEFLASEESVPSEQ